jgi:hypothetical protein
MERAMPTAKSKAAAERPAKPGRKRAPVRVQDFTYGGLAVEEAQHSGVMDGVSTHLSFRAPESLIEEAKRVSGLTSPTELGLAGLALLAQRDPVVEFLKRTRGRLGADHDLEY